MISSVISVSLSVRVVIKYSVSRIDTNANGNLVTNTQKSLKLLELRLTERDTTVSADPSYQTITKHS